MPDHARERLHYHFLLGRHRRQDLVVIRPFVTYIRWEEEEIISTIENELNWGRHPGADFTWGGDCDIALLKSHLYKATPGFNDKDEGLSYLIRDGEITRQEGLERLERGAEIPEKTIEEILDRLGLRLLDLETASSTFKKPSA